MNDYPQSLGIGTRFAVQSNHTPALGEVPQSQNAVDWFTPPTEYATAAASAVPIEPLAFSGSDAAYPIESSPRGAPVQLPFTEPLMRSSNTAAGRLDGWAAAQLGEADHHVARRHRNGGRDRGGGQ